MKLARTTEWALIAGLIAYIAFTPGVQAIKDILATPLGKAAALAGIVYVWKCVSPIVAILLTISFLRCARWNIWERFSGAETSCTCETPDAVWDSESKTCKDASGNTAGPVKTCTCSNGYAWDGGETGKKECVPVTNDQAPIPPAANPVAGALEEQNKAAAEAEAKRVAEAAAAEKAAADALAAAAKTTGEGGATAPTTPETEGFAGMREFFAGVGTTLSGAAPVTGGRRGPSEVPMTTGSAGASLLRDNFVPSQGYGGVQPSGGRTTASVPASA